MQIPKKTAIKLLSNRGLLNLSSLLSCFRAPIECSKTHLAVTMLGKTIRTECHACSGEYCSAMCASITRGRRSPSTAVFVSSCVMFANQGGWVVRYVVAWSVVRNRYFSAA